MALPSALKYSGVLMGSLMASPNNLENSQVFLSTLGYLFVTDNSPKYTRVLLGTPLVTDGSIKFPLVLCDTISVDE